MDTSRKMQHSKSPGVGWDLLASQRSVPRQRSQWSLSPAVVFPCLLRVKPRRNCWGWALSCIVSKWASLTSASSCLSLQASQFLVPQHLPGIKNEWQTLSYFLFMQGLTPSVCYLTSGISKSPWQGMAAVLEAGRSPKELHRLWSESRAAKAVLELGWVYNSILVTISILYTFGLKNKKSWRGKGEKEETFHCCT